MEKCIRKVKEIAYHRNGIGGEPFYAVLFMGQKSDGAGNMLAIVFNEPDYVAVIDLDRIAEHGVKFGANSWRGDNYAPELRAAIAKYSKAQGA